MCIRDRDRSSKTAQWKWQDGKVTQQISESPLTDHETVHVQRNEAERGEVENQPSVEIPLSGEKPSQVKVHRSRTRRPPRQFVAGNEAPCVESYQLSSVPAPDEATKLTETEQPGSGTTVHRASIGEEKSLSELELGKAKSPLK